jgi:hypothetical protein
MDNSDSWNSSVAWKAAAFSQIGRLMGFTNRSVWADNSSSLELGLEGKALQMPVLDNLIEVVT